MLKILFFFSCCASSFLFGEFLGYVRGCSRSSYDPLKKTKNGFTREQEWKIIKEATEALKHGKRYPSAGALFKDL